MKLTKAMVRQAWENEPGLRDLHARDELQSQYPNCAVISVDEAYRVPGKWPKDLPTILVALNDYGFSHEFGVTPEERRDCMIALLDAGAFDAWLE